MQEKAAKKYYVIRNELMECYKTMSATCKCKENSEAETFPTTHVDKTARIQIVEEGQFLNELLNELKNYSIDILANSSLNLSGDPTSFDLIDTLMISSRSPLEYIVSDFGVLKAIQ
jgi:carbamoyltransferase